jgi:hypothetical protein
MDSLHQMLRSLRTETKAAPALDVFREFLAQLDALQRQARAPKRRDAPAPRRKPVKRAKAG